MAHWAKVGVKCTPIRQHTRSEIQIIRKSGHTKFPVFGDVCEIIRVHVAANDVLSINLADYDNHETDEFYEGYAADDFRPLTSQENTVEALKRIALDTDADIPATPDGPKAPVKKRERV